MEIQDLFIFIILFSYCSGRNQSLWQLSPDENTEDIYFYKPNISSENQIIYGNVPLKTHKTMLKVDPTYFITASRTIRPGQLYRIVIHILQGSSPVTVKATVVKNGLKLIQSSKICRISEPETISLKIPIYATPGKYKLYVEGYIKEILGGIAFFNESDLHFSQQSMAIIIQTDQPFYKQGQTVNFRALPIIVDLKAFKEPLDIFMLDPNGHVVKRWLSHRTNFGVVSLSYTLPDQVTPGIWRIRVSTLGQMEEQKYIVEEYYPTRFEVEVTLPSFIFDTDEFIKGIVQANYTSGAPVHANLTLLVSVHSPCIQCSNDNLNHFTERFVPYFDGIHYFQISFWELRRLSSVLNKKQVTVRAIVGDKMLNKKITGYASTLISNTDVNLKFVGHEPQIFKPFSPLKVYLALSYQDGSAVPLSQFKQHKMEIQTTVIYKRDNNEQLKKRDLNMMANNPGMWEVVIDLLSEPVLNHKKLKDIKALRLEAKYKDSSGISSQAKLSLFRQLTPKDHHISITTSTKTAKIISKGLILSSGTESITSSIRTFAANVTSKMVPAATIIVYHVNTDGEIIADSLSFPVEGFPKNNFNISVRNLSGKLNDSAEIIVKGKPGLYVALSSSNEIMHFVNSKNKFSHVNLLQSLAKFDSDKNGTLHHMWISKKNEENIFVTFPSTSYAPDSFKTFEYAGIIVFTDGNLRSLIELCNGNSNLQTCATGKCYTLNQRCDGKADCEDGSDEALCLTGENFDLDMWKLYRQNHIQRFYESSWLWKDVIVGLQGNTVLNVSIPKQMTQWKINGFSVGKNRVITVMEKPIKFRGERKFYVTLELPNVCKEGEQIGLQATVFNNNPYELQSSINIANSRDYKVIKITKQLDSSAEVRSNKEFSRKVILHPFSSVTVHIPIIPNRIGEINVTVMAQSQMGKYSVFKTFLVEPYGIPQYKHSSILLDLSNRAYLIKYFDINLTERSDILLYNETQKTANFKTAILSVSGNVVGPLFPNIPMNTSSIFKIPLGSGEQNIFNFAINVYMLKYMNKTHTKNIQLEKKIFHYLNGVYARQLSYQASNGGFKMFRRSTHESVWLTSTCIHIFNEESLHDWEYFLYIDPEVINKALRWLLQHQTRYGAFFEEFMNPYDQKMNMASKKKDDNMHYRNITLTAHVTITLLSVKKLDKEMNENIKRSINLAVNYLERMLKIVQMYSDPYDLAIITYALTLATSPHIGEAFDLLNQKSRDVEGMIYWGKEVIPPPKYNVASNKPLLQARLPYKHDSHNIETTAYALLVFLKRHELFKEQIVNWLNFQRLTTSGWASTQDTLIAYQALLEYFSSEEMQGTTDMSIIVDATSSPGFEKILNVNDGQILGIQTVQIPNSWGTVRLLIKGKGMAVAQLSVQYNVDNPQMQLQPPISAFSLIVNIDFSTNNSSHLGYESCQKWLLTNESETSGMAILEIEIPTGYYIQQQDLDAYVYSDKISQLKNAQLEDRKIIFYFSNLDSTEVCIHFVVERWFPIAKLTKVMHAKLYDYYSPEKFNETFIDCTQLNSLNICDVCGSTECPPCITVDHATVTEFNLFLLFFLFLLHTVFYSA